MNKQRLKENFYIAMGSYSTHRKEILDFDRWYEATTSIKHNLYIKELKSELSKKLKEED